MNYDVYQDANDILIKKRNSEMVILLSKKQAYISINGEIRPANKSNINDFFSGLETDTLQTGVRWLPSIAKGAYGAKSLENIINNFDAIKPLADRDLFIMPKYKSQSFHFYTIPNSKMSIFIDISEIFAELVGRDIIASIIGAIMTKLPVKFDSADFHPDEWQKIAKAYSILGQFQAYQDSFFAMYVAYGHSGARNILKAIMNDCTIDTIPDDLYKLAPENQNRYRLRWERIVEYMVNERKKQGYTHDFATFLNEWTDTLKASYTIHETVDERGIGHNRVPKDEKYPSYLASLHRKNSDILQHYSQKNEASLYTARRITLKIYEYTTKDKLYTFRLPLSDADMIKEAQQQDNCLAGYTTAHATGETTIVFMRYTASPDKSLVTIERRGDRVIQKYRACNRPVSEQEEKAIQEWLRETCEAKLIEQRVKEEVQKRLKNVQEDQHKSTGSHTA